MGFGAIYLLTYILEKKDNFFHISLSKFVYEKKKLYYWPRECHVLEYHILFFFYGL